MGARWDAWFFESILEIKYGSGSPNGKRTMASISSSIPLILYSWGREGRKAGRKGGQEGFGINRGENKYRVRTEHSEAR